MEIPKDIQNTIKKLKDAGFEGYIVGGCTRDLLLDIRPKDWDVTTNAKPEDIQKIFPDSFYENKFGTVTVKTGSEDETLKEVEITTYRIEEEYTDKRHPDKVSFTSSLEEDLARRDFTINAIVMDENGEIKDPFDGQKDLGRRLVRAVREPSERFNEDALRMLRAIRLANQLGFDIEEKTLKGIAEHSELMKAVSKERIRDEFNKIISHTPPSWLKDKEKRGDEKSNEVTDEEYKNGAKAFELMRETGLLKIVLPELEEGYGVSQNKHHVYTVWEHNLRAFVYSVKENFNFETRLSALFHDIGKPQTKRGEGLDSTFYGHDVVGAKITARVMDRLKFPKKQTEKAVLLVRYHLFQSDPDLITDYAVRKIVRNVGEDNVWDLINLRLCDRIGSGVPKAEPYRLRKYLVMLEKALREPVSLRQLKTDGDEIMKHLDVKPGKRVGFILNTLMNEVLDDPKNNNKEYLFEKAGELNKLTDEELENSAKEAIFKMEGIEIAKEGETKEKYSVE